MVFVVSGGVRLWATSTGEGTPVVLVHEFAGDERNWADQVRFLARRGFQCITFNARGYPPSDVPEGIDSYSQAHAVGDIASVMRHFGVERAHVIGLSMGGYAALNFAIAHPEMTRSIVVAGAGHGSDPDRRERFLADSAALAERLTSLGMKEGSADYANSPVRRRFREKDPSGFEAFNRQFAEHSAIGSSLTIRGCQMRRPTIFALQHEIERLAMPALIIAGDDDEPCIEPALFMKRHIPNARLWIVPRTTHTVNLEEPEAFNRVVADFLADVDRDG